MIGWLAEDPRHPPCSFIIAAPSAMLRGWLRELRKWLPVTGQQNRGIQPLLYQGTDEERAALRATYMDPFRGTAQFPLVITSFETCILDGTVRHGGRQGLVGGGVGAVPPQP